MGSLVEMFGGKTSMFSLSLIFLISNLCYDFCQGSGEWGGWSPWIRERQCLTKDCDGNGNETTDDCLQCPCGPWSGVCGKEKWRQRLEGKIDYLIETHVPPVFRIETPVPGTRFLIDSISYNNTDCGVTTGVVIDINNAYEYVDTTGRCGDITIFASFEDQECQGLNGIPLAQGNFQIDFIQISTICCLKFEFMGPLECPK